MRKNSAGVFLILFFTIFLSSCGGMDSIIVKQGYDFSKIKRVAVLEFKNAPYTANTAGSMASELFTKYLLQTGYNVIERDEINSILREHQLSVSGALNPEQVKEFGKIAGVDAIITGSITIAVPEREFYENGNPRFISAQAGITCRMISVETGEILWAGSDTYDGMNTQTAFEYLISSLVRQLMRDLTKR
jgi:curli biogenesis system outer membrane secretion channel CsgG